ncbi:MAG: regulatory protein RecX [Clostridiales bacterium]|nr:regulatory protein RecX [Clostridiales bacterium]
MSQIIVEIKKQRGSFVISFEFGEDIRIPIPVLREHPLKTGKEFDENEYLEETAQTAYQKALQKAVWLLSRRDYSEQQLRKKLVDAAYRPQTCERVCDFLKAGHYLDDARYAENFIMRRKSKSGSRKLSMDLRYKGIENETTQTALESFSQEEEIEAACKLAKKYLSTKALEPQEAFRKCAAYLARRGYSWDTVKAAYRMVSDSQEDDFPL